MSRVFVRPAKAPLRGSVPVPSDKSISHRALIFAALSRGTCTLRSFSYGEDNVATLRAFEAMGVRAEDDEAGTVVVHGVGLDGLREPTDTIDCGNSGTTLRLLTGVLAAQPFRSRLVGDASLSRRPMGRVVHPLRARGAIISGEAHPRKEGDLTAPLVIGPLPEGTRLAPCEYQMPIASAQVKSAMLLSGLFAAGPTLVQEPVVSRDHTERMLQALGMPLEAVGSAVSLHPPADPRAIAPFDIDLPGDLSAAAFLLVAGQLVGESVVTTRHTGTNPTRSGIVDILRAFGADVTVKPQSDALGEPIGEITSRSALLRGCGVGGELAVRAIDEIPIAAVLAARSSGTTDFGDVGELRVKESDRVESMVKLLTAFGVTADERSDGFMVHGRPEGRLVAARVASGGDHRIAMSAAILGLVADGETVVEDADCIATSFPRFAGTLRALGADVEIQP